MVSIPSIPTGLGDLLVFLVGLVILWVIISIPVYFAAKVVKGGRASFGEALGATLGGGLVYFLVYFIIAIFLGAVIGASASVFAIIVALIAWVAVYRAAFKTGWFGAIAIIFVAWIILIILDFVLVHAFGVKFPDFFPF
jgi:hypothetical protein